MPVYSRSRYSRPLHILIVYALYGRIRASFPHHKINSSRGGPGPSNINDCLRYRRLFCLGTVRAIYRSVHGQPNYTHLSAHRVSLFDRATVSPFIHNHINQRCGRAGGRRTSSRLSGRCGRTTYGERRPVCATRNRVNRTTLTRLDRVIQPPPPCPPTPAHVT